MTRCIHCGKIIELSYQRPGKWFTPAADQLGFMFVCSMNEQGNKHDPETVPVIIHTDKVKPSDVSVYIRVVVEYEGDTIEAVFNTLEAAKTWGTVSYGSNIIVIVDGEEVDRITVDYKTKEWNK